MFLGVGPCLGSVAATGFYKLLLLLEYQTANPNQDHDGIHREYPTGYPSGKGLAHAHTSGSVAGGAASNDEISVVRGSELV